MADRENVIYSIERCICNVPDACRDCGYDNEPYQKCFEHLLRDAHDLLKAQELPDVKPEKLEERTTKWLDQMTAEERLEEIAAILDDWDGYRTAKGLGGLINEVWAYALYPVKAQEPRVMTYDEMMKAEICFLEVKGIEEIDPFIRYEVDDKSYWTSPYTNSKDNPFELLAEQEEYLINARCWTSRPTDEQRKETQWSEPQKEG